MKMLKLGFRIWGFGEQVDSEIIKKKRNVVEEIYFGEEEDYNFYFIYIEFEVFQNIQVKFFTMEQDICVWSL